MQNLPFSRQLYYAYLGRAFAFAYHTRWQQFLGYSLSSSSWIKFLTLVLWLVAFIWRWGTVTLILLFTLMVGVQIFYWRAARQGYQRFVPAKTAVLPGTLSPLPKGQRVSLFATGTYALADREDAVVLRPAEYWVSRRGEHSVMVSQYPNKYLYQFFQPETLQTVQPGWMVFGKTPLPTLAITFRQTWGPTHADGATTYTVGGEAKNSKGKNLTIYFTFADTAVQNQVWLTLLKSKIELPGNHSLTQFPN
jgi:hypothetical protein